MWPPCCRPKICRSVNDALYYRDEVRATFLHGDTILRERAYAERLFWHIMTRIARELPRLKYVPKEKQKLEAGLADVPDIFTT